MLDLGLNGNSCTVYCVLYIVEIPCICAESDLATVKGIWTFLIGRMTATTKVKVLESIMRDVGKYDADAALLLKTELLKLSRNNRTVAAGYLFLYLSQMINIYPDVEELRAYVQYDADNATFTGLARAYGNAPLIARSIVT